MPDKHQPILHFLDKGKCNTLFYFNQLLCRLRLPSKRFAMYSRKILPPHAKYFSTVPPTPQIRMQHSQ
jgi:hypothetical protein